MAGTITGTYLDLDQVTPSTGHVLIVPSVPQAVNSAGNVVLVGTPIRVVLDEDGAFSQEVPGYDEVGINPQGITYTVIPRLTFGTPAWITGLRVNDGQTVDASTATPIDPALPVYDYQQWIADLEAFATTADAAATLAVDISNIAVPDNVVAVLVNDTVTPSDTRANLNAVLAEQAPGRVDSTKHAPAFGLWFPEAEGAVRSGVANDGPAVQAAIAAAAAAGGGTVVLRAGTYLCTTAVSVKPSNVTIQGSPGAILKSGVASGTAFTLGLSGATFGFRMHDVKFQGGAGEAVLAAIDYCLDAIVSRCKFELSSGTGVQLARPQNLTFISNDVRENQGWGCDVTAQIGIPANAGQQAKITHNTFFHNGLAGTASVGGLRLGAGGEHMVCFNGFEKHDAHADSPALLLTSLRHCVNDNIFEWNYVPIQFGDTTLGTSGDCTVTRNKIKGGKIKFSVYRQDRFEGNLVADYTSGVPAIDSWSVEFATHANTGVRAWWLGNTEQPAGPPNARVTDSAPAGTIAYDDIRDNVSTGGRRTFVDLDTTPDIRGFEMFNVTNTAATSITGFDGGYAKKVFTVRATNGNTTLVHGANLSLQGNRNYTLLSGDHMTFRCDSDGIVREISRRLGTTGSANPDTSGLTTAQLETEVNQLKAALRTFGVIAP